MSFHAIKVKGRFYINKDIIKNGKHSTATVERLGSAEYIMETYGCDDPAKWAKERALELDMKDRESKDPEGRHYIMARDNVRIPKGKANSYNVGYLPLQKIYYDLKIPSICRQISRLYDFEFDLNDIFSRLIYSQVLFPGSKLQTTELSKKLFEHPDFQYHQVLRALSVISRHFDEIQERIYKNSLKVVDRKNGIIYYDCTNYYFEIEKEDPDVLPEKGDSPEVVEEKKGSRKYAHSKQHQPAPVIQVGLIMDYSGLPVSIIVTRGSRNEQTTLQPIEKKLLKGYGFHDFIVCTDAGLSSDENRKFNNFAGRAFITTVSIKKMKKDNKTWCLSETGWHLEGEDIRLGNTYDISKIDADQEDRDRYYERLFYKELLIEGYDEDRDVSFNQTLLVTYSLKHRDYQRQIRNAQVERARKAVARGQSAVEKKNQNDCRRFILPDRSSDGKKVTYRIDEDLIREEARYDGFYAMMHNLEEADTSDVLRIMKGRWEIEESFRITKTHLRARPIYLAKKERIQAHLLIVFIALLFYRILERKLKTPHTDTEIIECLRDMNIAKYPSEDSYHPAYTRTDLTDEIHEYLGFYTDYERMTDWRMRGNCRETTGTSKRKKSADNVSKNNQEG